MVFLRLLIAFCGGLTRIDFLRREVFRRDPPVCFLKIFDIVFLNASLGDFLPPTTSKISGTLCFKNSLPIRFAVGKIKRRAKGSATLPIPAARAPKPLPLWR